MNIKNLRISKDLTQQEAANLVGLSLRTYQNYEYEKSKRDMLKINYIMTTLTNYSKYSESKGIYTLKEIEDLFQ